MKPCLAEPLSREHQYAATTSPPLDSATTDIFWTKKVYQYFEDTKYTACAQIKCRKDIQYAHNLKKK
jgi:hypothetical protein